MESIVVLGKGGIGKSTIAANVSVILAAKGGKVLHVGCDPKMDSTLALMGRRIRPFSEDGVYTGERALRNCLHHSRIKGSDCMEAGGPQAGVGCAGTGIGVMLDAIKESSLIERNGYDTVVFDVLGDVVCGGFAAPLRRGFASKAVLVVSEELLSLYAANNLVAMINNYSRNGVYLAGLAVNTKDASAVRLARDFARAVDTCVLGVVPRDPAVARAEKARKPVVALEPRSEAARSLARLAFKIASAGKPASPPRMLGAEEFDALMSGMPGARLEEALGSPGRLSRPKAPLAPSVLLEKAGFSLTGISGAQVVCSWKGRGGSFKIFIAPVSESRTGMSRVGDWAFCFAPGAERGSAASHEEFDRALKGLSGLRFDDFVAAFNGKVDFYGNVGAFEELASNSLLPGGDRPRDAHLGFGQWQRFLFAEDSGICVPPGSVIVEHGDIECRFSSCPPTPLSFFQTSAGLSGISGLSLGPHLPKDEREPSVVNTDFGYDDAAKGDEKKIAAALTAAAARTGPGGLVGFHTCCSPLVLSSDVAAFRDRAARELGVEVLLENFNNFYDWPTFETPEKVRARSAFVARRLAALGRVKPSADLNLVNFGDSRSVLSALLASKGLSMTPRGGDFYRDIASARLQVLPYADPVLTRAFDQLGLKWAAPGAPYGLAATRAWLSALFTALGEAPPREGFGPSKEAAAAYAAYSRRLAGVAAGFVASPKELGMLDGSGAVSGVPLVSFLSEAGLAIRLLAHAPDRPARALARIEADGLAARTRARVRLSFFNGPAALSKALARDRALRLVYSDIPLDPRIGAAGKSAFSAAMFEPGYEGAAETLRRLMGLCEWDFNERYFFRKSV